MEGGDDQVERDDVAIPDGHDDRTSGSGLPEDKVVIEHPPGLTSTAPWRPSLAFVVPVVALYTFMSSWLGLTAWPLGLPGSIEVTIENIPRFFADVWQDSLAADLMFIMGSLSAALASGWAAWRLTGLRRRGAWFLLAPLPMLALLANWLVYTFSFLLLSRDVRPEDITNFGDASALVLQWGGYGLSFTAFATLAWIAWLILGARRPLGDLRALPPFAAFRTYRMGLVEWLILVLVPLALFAAPTPWGQYERTYPTGHAVEVFYGYETPGGIGLALAALFVASGFWMTSRPARAGLWMVVGCTALAAVVASVPGAASISRDAVRLGGHESTFVMAVIVMIAWLVLASLSLLGRPLFVRVTADVKLHGDSKKGDGST